MAEMPYERAIVLRAVARSQAERARLATIAEAARGQIDEVATAAQEVIATARRERNEAREALAELWGALFGDEVPADWGAELERRRAEAAEIKAKLNDARAWTRAWKMAAKENRGFAADLLGIERFLESLLAEAEQANEAYRMSLANCRALLEGYNIINEDWEAMPDDWAAEEGTA
jgi:hypothetical protein